MSETTQEYEKRQPIYRPPDEVFDWLSKVENLPHYLPPVKESWSEGPAAAGKPGERIKMKVEIPGRYDTEGEGYFHADEEARRLEWGAEFSRDYSGWLTVEEVSGSPEECLVTAHLSFGPRSVQGEVQEEAQQDSDGDQDPLEDGVGRTLESIRRQIEEGRGKTSAGG
ncbi:SRPBCC family protein [Rubrobacter aplysinae]|uniref:SRPBCC family protein n=1 Tax=Rubrobacter aplysinae TaxID=909625 RepID=UPI00069D996D|nr:SRPBCC family protein [Rubrobacter aplysinae]